MTLASPHALWLLLLVPLLWWHWWRQRARHAMLISAAELFGPVRKRLQPTILLPVLYSAALIALIVALARPQKLDVSERIYAEGIAIMMVLDTSSSMSYRDMSVLGTPQTRLDIVTETFRRFVRGDDQELSGRPTDLIGLVRFARYADSVCPLTLDHDALLRFVEQLHVVRGREDGTAIGDALALAVERLKDLRRTAGSGEQLSIKSRVIILLTDGENNAGTITPEEAGLLAESFGIKVYTILAGSGPLSPRARAGAQALTGIAERTDGDFFRASSPRALQQVYERIDALERTRTEAQRYVRAQERAFPWLITAVACLAVFQLLSATWLRRLP
jgi:Ca-activated chloride channel family protein